jgi:hygromycin-B 7''-O-kinase
VRLNHLPALGDEAAWATLLANDAALSPLVHAVLARHGLADAPRTRYDSGSLPVYAVGTTHALKLFPPHERVHAATEARVMRTLQGALPIPTPRLAADETQDGWFALLMSQLPGQRLVHAWPTLGRRERDALADALGEGIAALHAIDATPLADIEPSWPGFVADQRQSAAERQRRRRLAPAWVAQIDAFLERWMPAPAPRLSLLHTELMREHLMVDGVQLSGLFDFEPAMVGAPEYDFASFGLFVACGDACFLRRALRAYGYADWQLDHPLQNRLMAHALLHRYSNLRWYLERMPAQEGVTTLEALAAQWWAL